MQCHNKLPKNLRTTLTYNVALEKFLVTKIGDYVLQGYCDLLYRNKDGKYVVVDWKTSSYFNKKAAEEKCGQLVIYAQSLMQAGVKMEDILICWNMLKYCNVEVFMKNGNKKVRTIERYKLGESLVSNARMWLKNCNYGEKETDEYLKQLIDSNSISCLPVEVQEKFSIDDCYVYVPLTQKLIDKWNNEIITTIKDINLRLDDYNQTKSEKCFWDTEQSLKEQSYYMANLMSYSPNFHKPYAEYLSKLEAQQNGDIFGNLLNCTTSKVIETKNNEPDLSWLDSL